MKNRTSRPKSRAALKRTLLILGGVLLLTAGAAAVMLLRLSPERHFRQADIPVAAAPEANAGGAAGAAAGGLAGSTAGTAAGVAGTGAGAGAPAGNSAGDSSASGAAQAGDGSSFTAQDGALEGSGASAEQGQSETRFNLLLLGIDARESEDSRTDVMMLAHVNLSRNEVNLVSIPRDTRVYIKGTGYTKINHAHLLGELEGGGHAGTMASLQAVSNLCGCSINYYMKTNFEGFVHFIDSIGGLDVKLDDPVKLTYAHVTIPAGSQHLSGDLTLKLVQERHSLASGDINRQQNQALVLRALIRTMLEPDNLVRIPALLAKVKKDVLDTNLSDSDLISLSLLAKDLKSEDIHYVQIPGSSGRAKDPLVGKELYYWIPDQKAWSELAKKVLTD
ncbi:LCP family protein [Paenibacillus pinistramenti]|uniref:LCP family protein n=1 Tax=Paenibacillus pinistramenti TaxID=1768003 RepID=UPI001107E27B|nr:LCP family protein [Paenibacillus pinistramenti]